MFVGEGRFWASVRLPFFGVGWVSPEVPNSYTLVQEGDECSNVSM